MNGYFEIRNVSLPVSLEISVIGYKTTVMEIADESEITNLSLTLQKEVYLADELLVSATRVEESSPFTHTELDREEISEMNTGRDIPYVVNQSPSAVATSDAGAGIGYTAMRIRGIDQASINVTINGIALNDAESHGVYWVDIPDIASGVSDIQIQRGIGSSTNGAGAFGATVNILTDKLNVKPYAEIYGGIGSFNTGKAGVRFGSGLLGKTLSFDGRLGMIKSDGYVDRASSDLKSYYFAANHHSGKTTIRLIAFGGLEETYQAWYGIDSSMLHTNRTFNYAGAIYNADGSISYYEDQVDHYRQNHYQLHLARLLTEKLRFNAALHYTAGSGYYQSYHQADSLYYYGIPDITRNGQTIAAADIIDREWLENDYYGIIYNIHFELGRGNIDAGGSANRYDGGHFGEVIGAGMTLPADYYGSYYENRGIKDDINAYLKYSIRVEKFLLLAELQYRNIRYGVLGTDKWYGVLDFSDRLSFLNPRIGLSYAMTEKNDVYLSVSRGSKEPNRNDYLNGENFSAEAQHMLDIESGYRYRFSEHSLEANVYYMHYENQLILTGEINKVGEALRDNSGRSYRAGIELCAGIRFTNWMKWRPNLTMSDARNISFVNFDPSGEKTVSNTPVSYSPRLIANNEFSFQVFKVIYLNLYSYYVGDQHLDNSGNDRAVLPAYHFHDARVEFRKKFKRIKELRIFCNAFNLLDNKYESNGYMWSGTPYYFPQAGANFLAGFSIGF